MAWSALRYADHMLSIVSTAPQPRELERSSPSLTFILFFSSCVTLNRSIIGYNFGAESSCGVVLLCDTRYYYRAIFPVLRIRSPKLPVVTNSGLESLDADSLTE